MSKLNTNSNSYIIIYSTILVVIVAFLLAFIFKALKPMQDANVALDVKKQILYSLNIRGLDGSEAEAKYAEVVKEEHEKDGQKVYLCNVDGKEVTVFSMKGMGLWGGISGYVAAINENNEWTVYGAYFNHEGETAGLGAEIKDSQAWQEKFIGKKILDENGNVILSVVKKVDNPESQVDCVTGATLTSNGVDAMLKEGLKPLSQAAGEDCCKNAAEHNCMHAGKDCSKDNKENCCKDAKENCCKEDCCKDCQDCKDGKECKDCKDCKENCCKDKCCKDKTEEE